MRLTPGPTPPWEESSRRKWLRSHREVIHTKGPLTKILWAQRA